VVARECAPDAELPRLDVHARAVIAENRERVDALVSDLITILVGSGESLASDDGVPGSSSQGKQSTAVGELQPDVPVELLRALLGRPVRIDRDHLGDGLGLRHVGQNRVHHARNPVDPEALDWRQEPLDAAR
jgi:hypothetical protein